MTKQQLLYRMTHGIGKVLATDLALVSGINETDVNKYAKGVKPVSDNQFLRLVDAYEEINGNQTGFLIEVKEFAKNL